MRNDQVSGALLGVLGLFAAWQSLKYPVGSFAYPGPGFLPLALGVLVAVFGLVVAAAGGRSPRLSVGQFDDAGKTLAVAAGLAFAALALERLGFRLTIAVLLIYYLGILERKHPALVGIIAAAMSLGSYYVFSTWLGVRFPSFGGGI